MIIRHILISGIIAASMISTGCQTAPSNQNTGQIVGGVVGGILGSQIGGGRGKTAATIAGVLVGAYIGGNIGRSMDANDQRKAYDALENNPSNQPSTWHNPDSNKDYTVTPTSSYNTAEGPCREYTTEVVIGGQSEIATGTACREADGSWRIVN